MGTNSKGKSEFIKNHCGQLLLTLIFGFTRSTAAWAGAIETKCEKQYMNSTNNQEQQTWKLMDIYIVNLEFMRSYTTYIYIRK